MDYPQHVIIAGGGPKAAVEAVQTALNAAGAGPVDVDGAFSVETQTAVRLFQARNVDPTGRPLEVDGVVGALTWAALMKTPVALAQPTAATPLMQKVLAVAAGKIGVREIPADSNKGPDVEAFLKSAGLPKGNAWCASFVYWCFEQVTGDGAGNPCPRDGSVHGMWRKASAAGRLLFTPAQVRAQPELVLPGQLFFLDTGGGHGHVGFIETVQGAWLTTIEGNTDASGTREGGGVYRRPNSRKIADISLGVADMSRPLG
jgi:hypothetical protein